MKTYYRVIDHKGITVAIFIDEDDANAFAHDRGHDFYDPTRYTVEPIHPADIHEYM